MPPKLLPPVPSPDPGAQVSRHGFTPERAAQRREAIIEMHESMLRFRGSLIPGDLIYYYLQGEDWVRNIPGHKVELLETTGNDGKFRRTLLIDGVQFGGWD